MRLGKSRDCVGMIGWPCMADKAIPGLRPFADAPPLGSIFSRSIPEPTPTPQVVALITRLESEDNVHPHDVSKQLARFDALVDTKS